MIEQCFPQVSEVIGLHQASVRIIQTVTAATAQAGVHVHRQLQSLHSMVLLSIGVG